MDTYAALKSLHVLGVVIFIGNIVVTGYWKLMADRTRDPPIIAFAQRQVTATDWIFTFGGVLLVGIGGYANAELSAMVRGQVTWLWAGHWLFVASGVIWAAVLIPLQIKLARLARGFEAGESIPAIYWPLERLWLGFGVLATVLPLANIPIMVFKPT